MTGRRARQLEDSSVELMGGDHGFEFREYCTEFGQEGREQMPEAKKEIIKAAKSGDIERVKSLLATDAHLINARDTDGSTPLHCAAWKGHPEIVALLLKAGADVNAQNSNDHWGTTALHAAAHANQATIAQLLIEHGADVNAQDSSGKMPMHHTTFHKAKAVARLLQKYTAS